MASLRHLACAASLIVAGSACSPNERTSSGNPPTTTFEFVPVQPLTRAAFQAFVTAADASIPEPGTDPAREIDSESAQNYFDQLCSGEPTLFGTAFTYPSQAAAYEQLFDAVEAQCEVDPAALDTARGEAAWNMTRNRLALDRMLAPDGEAVSGFCGALDATGDLTSAAIASAATHVGLISETEENLVELAVSFLIQACPQLLDAVRS